MNSILLIGNSGGIGQALQGALEARGASVTGLSRRDTGLDLSDEASIEGQLSALSRPFDAILVASGALEINGARPEKALSQLTQSAFLDQFIVNAAGPALILKHAPRLLPKDRPSQFAALSARVGSIGDNRIGGWYSYRAAKAALNQIIHTGAIELARTHKQAVCVALHPGTVQTPFTAKYLGRHPSVPASQAALNLLSVLEGLGPDKTGQFFDWEGKPVPW
tara:strand:- start:4628 stop:5293 length:666 start_codon:yes stop_codon:yes gene_type:complete